MTSANSGSVTEHAGSSPLNGSNETVTVCRLATAKAMMMMASGTRMIAATILRSKAAGNLFRQRNQARSLTVQHRRGSASV